MRSASIPPSAALHVCNNDAVFLLPATLMRILFCLIFVLLTSFCARVPRLSCPSRLVRACVSSRVRRSDWRLDAADFSLFISFCFWPLSLKTGGPETWAAVENHQPASSLSNRRAVSLPPSGPRPQLGFLTIFLISAWLKRRSFSWQIGN